MEVIFTPEAIDDLRYWKQSGNKVVQIKITELIKAIELKIMSDIVIEYEEFHFPIGHASLAEVVKMRLEQEEMSQRDFVKKLGVSPSMVSDYLKGKCEPTLKIARNISKILNIEPAIILGI